MDESFKNRVIGQRLIHSDDLVPHPSNPRQHSSQEKAVMRGILQEIGIAGTLLVYRSARAGGKYVVIDGHMRTQDFPGEWPCTELDINDDQADLLIQVFDPVAQMAVTDLDRLRALREKDEFSDTAVRIMLDNLEEMAARSDGHAANKKDAKSSAGPNPVPEMDLKPYEHYDYVFVMCRNLFDWNFIVDRLELKRVSGDNDPRYKPKIGLGRGVSADRLIKLLRDGEEARKEVEHLRQEVVRLGGKVSVVDAPVNYAEAKSDAELLRSLRDA